MKTYAILMLLMVSILPAAMATPPLSIELTYDISLSALHVNAPHTSSRLEKHYLRKMVVSLNGVEQAPLYYHRQASPIGFTADVAMKAKAGDRISVELSCSEGGVKSGDVVVKPLAKDLKIKS